MKRLSETNWEEIVKKGGKFLGPDSAPEIPMRKHPRTGEMVPDPFDANKEALKRGVTDAPATRREDPFAKHRENLRKGIVHEDDDVEEAVRVMGRTGNGEEMKRLEKNKSNPNAQAHRDETARLAKQVRSSDRSGDFKQVRKEVPAVGGSVMKYNSKPRTESIEMNELNEKKWIKTDPDKKGMFKGKTKAELEAEKEKLKKKDKKHPGKVSDSDHEKMAELNFAIRAKSKGGLKEGLVKKLRTVLESQVSQAEVMMAAKGFAQELQEMIEKIGRLQNEDLPPVTDQMRETYGTDNASTFQTEIYAALQTVMNSLYTAKGQIDDAVENLATTGNISASVDMDVDVGMEEPVDDLDGVEDEFGADEMEDPLGHVRKESVELQSKILEMKRLVDKARKLREHNTEDRLDELSPATLGSYARKAKGEARWANGVAGATKERGSDAEAKPYADLAKKRREGAANAEKKSGVKQSPDDYEPYDWQKKGGYGDKSNPAMK